MKNMYPVIWFEIPTQNIARAQEFYESVFSIKLQAPTESNGYMATFPGAHEHAGAMGALVTSKTTTSTQQGTVVYLVCSDMNEALQRVEENGGQVLVPRTDIGENGYFAHFCDTEGNRVGLYSAQ